MAYTITCDATTPDPTYFNGGAQVPAGLYFCVYLTGAWQWEVGSPTPWRTGQINITNGAFAEHSLRITGANTVDSWTVASNGPERPFESGDVGKILVINPGGGFTGGTYTVIGVAGGVATLNGSPGTSGSTGGTGTLYASDGTAEIENLLMTSTEYDTQADAEAATSAIILFTHAPGFLGGTIVDGYYADNANGSPSPQLLVDVPVTITSTPCACTSRGVTLTWTTPIATYTPTTVSISGIGTVAANGTMTVYPSSSLTYTISATNTFGAQTASTTVMFPSNMILLPSASSAPVYFNSGASFFPGVYLITCCGGAFSWNGIVQGVNANNRRIPSSQAFKVFGSQGTQIDAPGNYPGYASVAASDSANVGLTQVFNHAGGPIGVFLNLDSYASVVEGSEPPGFAITGPAPTVLLTANASPVIAGTAATLSWSVTGSTDAGGISISGIGTVSASGSQSVTVTQTTRYTLTATYAGLTVTTYADVLIGTPSVPQVAATPACGGTVGFSWTAPAFTTQTFIERSATGGGAGFVQIAAVNAPQASYTDTPPMPGTAYYYRLRNTDGYNFSAYTLEFAEASLLPPVAVTSLAVSAPLGVPILTWTASAGSTSYLVMRGTGAVTAPQQVVVLLLDMSFGSSPILPPTPTQVFTIPVTSPGQQITASDPTATNGLLTFYTVVGVNACGQGVASNEVSVTPGLTTSPYVATAL